MSFAPKYTLLPEEALPKLNDFSLSYTIEASEMPHTERDAICPFFVSLPNSIVEVVTRDIAIEEYMQRREQETEPEKKEQKEEVEFEIEIDEKLLEEAFEMFGIEGEENEKITTVKQKNQHTYEMTDSENKKQLLGCSSIDQNKYLVLTASRKLYRVGKSFTVRKIKEA